MCLRKLAAVDSTEEPMCWSSWKRRENLDGSASKTFLEQKCRLLRITFHLVQLIILIVTNFASTHHDLHAHYRWWSGGMCLNVYLGFSIGLTVIVKDWGKLSVCHWKRRAFCFNSDKEEKRRFWSWGWGWGWGWGQEWPRNLQQQMAFAVAASPP